MHANSREDIEVARTGDIVAVAGLKNIITGETLCDEKAPIILERMDVSLLIHSRIKLTPDDTSPRSIVMSANTDRLALNRLSEALPLYPGDHSSTHVFISRFCM